MHFVCNCNVYLAVVDSRASDICREMDLKEFAAQLGTTSAKLTALAYGHRKSPRYLTFTIPKRGGGARSISAPTLHLKETQSKIKCWLEERYRPPASAQGFIKERGIVSNASKHVRRSLVLNFDLKDFFPSITIQRVRGVLEKAPFSLTRQCAWVVATLLTHEGALPQGSPASPIVSNMICKKLDRALIELARITNCFFTRYADDITFSTNMPSFSDQIMTMGAAGPELAHSLVHIIETNGFSVNRKKTRIANKNKGQYVTGIKTNRFLNVNRIEIKKTRAILHSIEKFGYEKAEEAWELKYRKRPYRNPYASLRDVVLGRIAFIGQVRGNGDPIHASLRRRAQKLWDWIKVPDHFGALYEAWKDMQRVPDSQRRGYLLEELVGMLFDEPGVTVTEPFRRNAGAEQIDGALSFSGETLLVECKYYSRPVSSTAADGFHTKIGRSGDKTMGLFISMSGWKEDLPDLIKQNNGSVIILMNGDDIEAIIEKQLSAKDVIKAKLEYLRTKAEPYMPVGQ